MPVPAADVLLFNAARAQLISEVIAPALEHGEIVICDRFADSTLAYQGYGDQQPLDGLRAVQDFAIGDLRPNLTVLIDLPVEEGLARKRDKDVNRFEEWADVAFHRRVREGFLALAAGEPTRFVVLDGRKSTAEISERLYRAVLSRLKQPNPGEIAPDSEIGDENHSNSSEPERTSVRMDR
jgi:dTMP kinase